MKNSRRTLIILLVILLFISLAVAAPHIAYRSAEKLMLSGNYDTARQIFEILGDFRDSSARIEEIGRALTYKNAGELLQAGKYDAAYDQYSSLGTYLDSEVLMTECRYQQATSLMHAEKYDEACALFRALDGYQDSEALITECSYQYAISLLHFGPDTDHEKVAQAREIFLSLENYQDSAQYAAQFRKVNIALSRAYIQSGENLGTEPLWYDALGRLTGRGTVPEQYAYDEQGRLIYDAPDHIEYDEQGRILKTSNEERSVTYNYDKKGNEISRTYYYTATGKKRTRPVRYDRVYSGGLLKQETFYDNNMKWTVNLYTYDSQGHILEHTVQSYGGKPYSTDQTYRYAYHEDGTLAQTEYIYPEAERCYVETALYGYIWTQEAQ